MESGHNLGCLSSISKDVVSREKLLQGFFQDGILQTISASSPLYPLLPFSPQSGLTALHLAAQEDKVNVADILVRHGANQDAHTKVQAPVTVVVGPALGDSQPPHQGTHVPVPLFTSPSCSHTGGSPAPRTKSRWREERRSQCCTHMACSLLRSQAVTCFLLHQLPPCPWLTWLYPHFAMNPHSTSAAFSCIPRLVLSGLISPTSFQIPPSVPLS